MSLSDPAKYGDYFYELYTLNSKRALQQHDQKLSKRKRKSKRLGGGGGGGVGGGDGLAAAAAAAAGALDGNEDNLHLMDSPLLKEHLLFKTLLPVVSIELEANASRFAVYSAVRALVLEAETRYALFQSAGAGGLVGKGGSGGGVSKKLHAPQSTLNNLCCLLCAGNCLGGNLGNCACHAGPAAAAVAAAAAAAGGVGGGAGAGVAAAVDAIGLAASALLAKKCNRDSLNSEGDSESDDAAAGGERETNFMRVPLIVSAGLRSLFELIADTRHSQPVLCTKAMQALLDVIQGQQPETFRLEPDDLMNPLYDLLLNLATIPVNSATAETNWSSMACAALLGLCIARGDTGKILKAVSAILMSPKQLFTQSIQMPAVLASLQKTVICTVLNRPIFPDLHKQGLPLNSLVDQFPLRLPTMALTALNTHPSIVSDGVFIYLLHGGGLFKIGSGFGGSYKGHIYAKNEDFTKEKTGWLGFCNGVLYFRRQSKHNTDHLHVISTETLTIKGIKPLNVPLRDGFNYVVFTDEDSFNIICPNRDDTLVIKKLNIPCGHSGATGTSSSSSGGGDIGGGGSGTSSTSANSNAADALPYELPLQLARKKFRTLGYAAFEDEVLNQQQIQKIQSSYNLFEPKLPNDVEIQGIVCGKEFGLVRGSNGKVYYYGKSLALGLKAVGRTPTMKMTELIVSKVSSTVQIALGHDGIHALLVNDDGTVYFTGTARRGEDGDTSKNRRQPKAVKPKKISKVDGHVIVQAACNNGTSAFVTKTGKLIMYGKDTAHCDAQGFVSDFLDQHITKVALGKAHCVALNGNGQLFTFGLNNKGQCGRGYTTKSLRDDSTATTLTPNNSSLLSEEGNVTSTTPTPTGATTASGVQHHREQRMKSKFDFANLCDYDDHNVVQGQCRVCILCRECTGYNVSCVSNLNTPIDERIPGEICPCGHGDAGCSKCGLCFKCISVQENENDASKDVKLLQNDISRQRSKSSLFMRRKDKKALGDDHSNTALDIDKEPPRVAPLPPQLLQLPSASPVVQIACGLHHTVVLLLSGEVYTFGSNQYGQLGTGDLQPVSEPVRVNVPTQVSQVAAGSNHTVLMTHKGMVYTFGNYQKGQLGRLPSDAQQQQQQQQHYQKVSSVGGGVSGINNPDEPADIRSMAEGRASNSAAIRDSTIGQLLAQRQKFLWHCTPGAVFGLGTSFGKRATWIGATGDQTFIKIDESLVTANMLSKINVVANKKIILLIPSIPLTFHALTINRRDGNCIAHQQNQVNFVQLIQSNKAKLAATGSEINQNIEQQQQKSPHNKPYQHQHATVNDQMSASMHEARNQLFNIPESPPTPPLPPSYRDHHNRRASRQADQQSSSSSSIDCGGSGGSYRADKAQPQIAFALDPVYNVLWVYDGTGKQLQCYNVIASEFPEHDLESSNYRALLSPELSLPNKAEAHISRYQASLNLLACLDVLTSTQDAIPECFDEPVQKPTNQAKEVPNDEYQIVNRFDNFGGGWGYSGHSVEAVRFSADTDVMICGFGMFGGRGEYTCRLKLYDLGSDGGGYEKDGILLSETKEVPFECAARSTHHIMLPKPVNITANRWYLICARIAGPSSDCGSCGQVSVTTEDQIIFNFKSSKKANNGTDVNSGQIPSILYRLITQETSQPTTPVDLDVVPKVSKAFANSVSKECFESLVLLLNWSWKTFKLNLREQYDKSRQLQVKQLLDYLLYVNKSCLRLLRKYINEIYPQRSAFMANTRGINSSCAINSNNRLAHHKGIKESESKKEMNISKFSRIPVPNIGKGHLKDIHSSFKCIGGNSGSSTGTLRKPNSENIQLAECIGNVRALLIDIFCDDIYKDICAESGMRMYLEVLDECHISFVACFDAFYPTSSLKWNCLCNLLSQMDKQGTLHSRLLSAILAGLCSPTVKLRSTFSLWNPGNDRQSIISPSDNSGLPMLCSTETHQYPILVEQMLYRTQQEKIEYLGNTWTFKDVLVRLLEIVANPIRVNIEHMHSRSSYFSSSTHSYGNSKDVNQGLIENCCHLLARVLAEIVYQAPLNEYDKIFMPPRCLHSTGTRFARCDVSRTWNTGNFGPDAIAFSVDRAGVAIAGAMIYSGSGTYDYQLELLYDNSVDAQSQHKWETLESVSGSYDQESVHNDMAEIKFERPVHIKENVRYALRLCSQGARTCSGDGGLSLVRGPCGTIFHFYACDLSFNGTTPQRGQIPCILYYSSTPKSSQHYHMGGGNGGGESAAAADAFVNDVIKRETALEIASDITKKCTELLIFARNTLSASLSPSDNSSNHTQTIDSEHNITPIEEHMDMNWANNSRTAAVLPNDHNMSMTRDLTKRIESFSKGIMETLKFEKRSTNPFEMEIEIGATEIHPKDLMIEENAGVHDLNFRNGEIAKLNGNERSEDAVMANAQQHVVGGGGVGGSVGGGGGGGGVGSFVKSNSDEVPPQLSIMQMLETFNMPVASLFHTLLPLVYAHIANLANSDPKSSVQILGLIKEILPHIAALNQLRASRDQTQQQEPTAAAAMMLSRDFIERKKHHADVHAFTAVDRPIANDFTTSNHYCVVESEHPYRSTYIYCYRIEFPPCVQFITIEFDAQCGTAQQEDYLLISIPIKPLINEPPQHQQQQQQQHNQRNDEFLDALDNNASCKPNECRNATLISSCYENTSNARFNTITSTAVGGGGGGAGGEENANDIDWIVVKKFNTPSNWMQNVLVLPGNCIEFSLETASLYAQDPGMNRFGLKCLVVGYDNPSALNAKHSCLLQLEQELAYLGGMCSANLMKKDLNLPDDKDVDDMACMDDTIVAHHALLSKGFAISEPFLTVHQALEADLPIGSQSIERQFLKDFINCAPGSAGARLAAWLQPEARLDPNKCELNAITESLRYGWPTPITVAIRDQYGDAVVVPELKVEIKAIPTGVIGGNGNIKMRRSSCVDDANKLSGIATPPRLSYEPTVKERMCFKAINFMKPFSNYSFEELRYSSSLQTRVTETLYAQDMEDGTFSVHWTPNAVGSYCLLVSIDGILLEEVYRVEVKEGGLPPPSQRHALKKAQPPSKFRKFYAKNTAGLRIRSHPTLQSEQLGVIKLNGIISFIDEIENDDGIWLRLSTESIRQHCAMGWYPTEAWCLQYNQHLNKTLLHAVASDGGECKSTLNMDLNAINAASVEEQLSSLATTATASNDGLSVGVGDGGERDARGEAELRQRMFVESVDPCIALVDVGHGARAAATSQKNDVASLKMGNNTTTTNTNTNTVSNTATTTNPFLSPNGDETDFDSSAVGGNDCSTGDDDGDVGVSGGGGGADTPNDSRLGDVLYNTFDGQFSSTSAQLGSTIAGVVEEGANKLHALQKWLKGDTIDGLCGGISAVSGSGGGGGGVGGDRVRPSQPPAQQSHSVERTMSVRELVRQMGGNAQELRSNGNASPMQISTKDTSEEGETPESNDSKIIVDLTTSTGVAVGGGGAVMLSNNELHHHHHHHRPAPPPPPSPPVKFDINTMRMTTFTASQTAALLSTPKHSPRKFSDLRRDQQQQHAVAAMMEEDASVLQVTTTTTTTTTATFAHAEEPMKAIGVDEAECGEVGGAQQAVDDANNGTAAMWPPPMEASSVTATARPERPIIGPIKRAMPPSLAESIRAVFAAFMWHEGIVHDAMACASFLKFHPSLPKAGATVVTRRDHTDTRLQLSREEKAQQRHSVEVANAGHYLNIRPSTLEALTKSGNSCVNNRKHRKHLTMNCMEGGSSGSGGAGGDKQKLHALPEIVTVLPPSLRCLVYLWDQICSNCIRMVQLNALEKEKAHSPSSVTGHGGMNAPPKKNLDLLTGGAGGGGGGVIGGSGGSNIGGGGGGGGGVNVVGSGMANSKEASKNLRGKKKDDGSWCEICEIFLPIPVTYHMRIAHPGCGKSAKGKGYNSVGIFCEGWAGNCGEGGKGASSWFLMCDACREKYMTNGGAAGNSGGIGGSSNSGKHSGSNNMNELLPKGGHNLSADLNLFDGKTNTLIANADVYITMRENAAFLLELSSSVSNLPNGPDVPASGGGAGSCVVQKRSPQQMPVVAEHEHLDMSNMGDLNKPSTSRMDGGSARNSFLGLRTGVKFRNSMFRKSFIATTEHIWQTPETFAYLESLGATTHDNMPYQMFGPNSGERPLSEVSHESYDPNYDSMTTSAISTRGGGAGGGALSKFHRSYSMGQGWAVAAAHHQVAGAYNATGGLAAINGEDASAAAAAAVAATAIAHPPKVIFRRRNNSTSESEGSLLICYPSENLRKLVPENMLATSIVQPAAVPCDTSGTNTNATNTNTNNPDVAALNSNCNRNANEQPPPPPPPAPMEQSEEPPLPVEPSRKPRLRAAPPIPTQHAQPAATTADKSNGGGWSSLMPPPPASPLNLECSAQLSMVLNRPALAFMTQKHDLQRLRYVMRRSLRIASCRVYSLQALNWLLRSVTQSVCLHDLMWWFVSSLNVTASSSSCGDGGSAGAVAAAAGAAAGGSCTSPLDVCESSTAKHEDVEPVLEHPVSYTQINGNFASSITQSLHQFLQSVADLTLHLPLGSPLQRIAIQCFGIRFRQADHQFLHSSHVFGNISKILSKTDEHEQQDESLHVAATGDTQELEHNHPAAAAGGGAAEPGGRITSYSDLSGMFEVTVSSRPAMADSLTDNSTETFWESDEEDRNKSKIVEISMTKFTYVCRTLLVHIDNSRDIQNKVLTVGFYAGQSLGDTRLVRTLEVDAKACTWLSAKFNDESFTHFRLEFHGPENTLRVRQIKLLGLPSATSLSGGGATAAAVAAALGAGVEQWNEHFNLTTSAAHNASAQQQQQQQQQQQHNHSLWRVNYKLTYAARIQQQICEAETLRVFRLITSQVFGKLISMGSSDKLSEHQHQHQHHHHLHHHHQTQQQQQQQSMLGMDSSGNSLLADSLDLREHMVGILFSRSKLSHLQKQVIVHIVHAIRKEAQRAKEEWELANMSNCLLQTAQQQQQQPHANAPATSMNGGAGVGVGGGGSGSGGAAEAKSESSNSERFRAPDTYCFEMLNMVLALSGSVVGRSYLSHQHGLLRDLLSLLHTGSDRVQRQVTALLRRILPEIQPEHFAELLGVQRLPPLDYSIAHQNAGDFDMNRICLLDIFLAVIAKSLQLQLKIKSNNAPPPSSSNNNKLNMEKTPSSVRLCNSLDLSVYLLKPSSGAKAEAALPLLDAAASDAVFDGDLTGEPNDRGTAKSLRRDVRKNLNQRWFLNGMISMKQAESIIALIRDLASGKLSEKWSQLTKAAIAESVLNLTRLDEIFRTPENCVKTATLWLAVASLCVLDRDHVDKLSSGQWSKVSETRPMCSNHDDGETAAIIQCEMCGSLCGDCDRFLHLNRKTRLHKRTVCKEEEEAIRVELHESCGRTKLYWLLALADSKTLKAIVEFRDGNHTIMCGPQATVGRCRFCGVTGNSGLLEISNVCADAQCQEYACNACMKTKPCGHVCSGVINETKCLPCLQNVCHARENELAGELHEPKLTQDADDMCMICFVEALSSAPSVQLECGHVFHYHCCKAVLEKRWNGPRITFGFSLCPICKADIQHELLEQILQPINMLKQDVRRKAMMRLKYEGVVKDGDAKDLTSLAMDRYAYYVCFKCQKAYYGGEARCDAEIGDKYDPEELVCGGCSDVARAQMCPKHGTDFLEYKCRYCCSVAVFFCFGTTHFCDTCHDDFQRLTNIPKNKLPQCPAGPKAKQLIGDECPLHVIHPPTGEEFALGCGVCRNAQTF